MAPSSTPFVVNSKITFCESEGGDAPRYTGLVKKTKESLVALIVSNKDKGSFFPDVGASIYFPFERDGAPWQAVATVAQNSSWPLLILELEGEAPVASVESPLYEDEGDDTATGSFPVDGSHLGDVEQLDDDLISLPASEVEEAPVAVLADNDELTDDELDEAEAGVDEALGGDDLLDGLPDMPDPLRDLPEVDDADLAAELDAEISDAMAQGEPIGPDGEGFDDALDDMAMIENDEISMDRAAEDGRIEQWIADEEGSETPVDFDNAETPLLSWEQTTPTEEIADEEDTEEVAVDRAVEEDIDDTATLAPGVLPAPQEDREFFPVTIYVGDAPPLPTGVDPAVAGIIEHLQRRLARLEANMGEGGTPLHLGPNGFCLNLAADRMVVALPAGCMLAKGDGATVAVDHQWRDRLSFQCAATVSATHQEEGVTVVTLVFDEVRHENEVVIETYLEGIGDWRGLLSRLALG